MTAPLLIDTHAHLDDEQFDEDRDAVIARAREAGVRAMINIGYRPGIWESTIALTRRYPEIRHTLGVHPHHADLWSDEVERALRALVAETRPVAVGEIGIDLYRNRAPLDQQHEAFEAQLSLAHEMGLPVVIHQRAAEAELAPILERLPDGLVCVLHSFEGSPALAELAIQRGHYLGVGGLMTRSRAEEVRAVLRTVPLDRILLETDSPYLVPAKVKNQRNEPANLPRVAEALAAQFEASVEEIARRTTDNAERIFGSLAAEVAG